MDYTYHMSDRSKEIDAFDLLDEELQQLKFHGDPGLLATLTAPWGLSFEATPGTAPFYVVSEGSCFVEVFSGPGESPHTIDLNAGDLVVLTRGDSHHLKSGRESFVRPAYPITPSATERERIVLNVGAGGTKTKLIGGCFRFDSAFAPPFLKSLEKVMLVRALDLDRHRNIRSVLELLYSEGSSHEHGTEAATAALLKLLFIQLIRLSIAEHRESGQLCEKNPIALMFDPSMQAVAYALHVEPEQPWSVAKLATLAGLSRTSFAVRFQNLTGIPPLTYLTRIRMRKAAERLERTDATLEAVRSEVGYGSEAAFSIAFKREMGLSPGVYRKNTRAMKEDRENFLSDKILTNRLF
jgi:AraC-like DNA-binding protein